MSGRSARKFGVAFGLVAVAVAGVVAASLLGLGEGPRGSVDVERPKHVPVPSGDLGEIVVPAAREDLPEVAVVARRALPAERPMAEVSVTAKRALPAEGVLAEVQVTAKRERSRVVELTKVAGVPAGALVQ